MHLSPYFLAFGFPAITLVAICACRQSESPKQKAASLVVSGDTAGWIMPCGCSSGQSGGLARRASYLESLRQTRDVIVADVGGAPGGATLYDVAKFVAIARGEVAMGTIAHNIGGAEAALGAEQLRKI